MLQDGVELELLLKSGTSYRGIENIQNINEALFTKNFNVQYFQYVLTPFWSFSRIREVRRFYFSKKVE